MSPLGKGRRERRLVRRNESYTADEEVELEPVPADPVEVPEADQVGDLEHEGGPDDGSH
jgi:hypothetical protein